MKTRMSEKFVRWRQKNNYFTKNIPSYLFNVEEAQKWELNHREISEYRKC